jgi:lysine 6-dehydrogenase
MKILVLGSGLMGPAAAFNAMCDPDVTHVALADREPAQLASAQARLAGKTGVEKLQVIQLDLADLAAASGLFKQYDVVVAALPNVAIPMGVRAAAAAGVPWVDLSWPTADQLDDVLAAVNAGGILAMPGCGVEPGLTEIAARNLADKLDLVDEVHIKCGGIPVDPNGPLDYKIVFGGRKLPIRALDARIAENGAIKPVPRYSGVETLLVDGVGEVEAWHEGFMPWLLELENFKAIKLGTQKTIRWPGYAAKITVLKDLGLLSDQPVDVDGVAVIPKQVVDAVLYPHVQMFDVDRDVTIMRVEVSGRKDGMPRTYRVDMVDWYDEELAITSMARVTAFTGAIVARMIGRGEIDARGWVTPEKVITGDLYARLLRDLRDAGVELTLTKCKTKVLGA